MSLLELMGYQRLGHYAGGLREWVFAKLPVESGFGRSVHPEERPDPR